MRKYTEMENSFLEITTTNEIEDKSIDIYSPHNANSIGTIITSTPYPEREMKRTLETYKNSSSRESYKPRRVIDTNLFKKVEISYGI